MTDAYWHALRFYTKSWRERHGADMVAMMHDARDNGEEPLSGKGRRSLMWSGLRQRFSSRPYVGLWALLTLLTLGLYEWATYRNLHIGMDADMNGTDGYNLPAIVTSTVFGLGFIACLAMTTASLLHRPAFPLPVAATRVRSWPGWVLFALGTGSFVAAPLVVSSLVIGVRRYRVGGAAEFRALAIASAIVFSIQLVVIMPALNLIIFPY